MPPKSVVVTGSNRGIGFGLIGQFLKNPDVQHVIATARDVEKATARHGRPSRALHRGAGTFPTLRLAADTLFHRRQRDSVGERSGSVGRESVRRRESTDSVPRARGILPHQKADVRPGLFQALHAIQDPRLHILQLSLNSDESISKFAEKVAEIVGENGLTLLVNNAAVMLPYVTKQEPDRKIVNELFETNTIGPMILTQALIPLIVKSSQLQEGDSLSISRGAIINIASEFLGSISENTSGSGEYRAMAYRMTKCAVNQFTRTLSIDLRQDHVLAAGVCPGMVQTDMSGGKGALTIEQSATQLVDAFNNLNENHTGGYFRRDLSAIPF